MPELLTFVFVVVAFFLAVLVKASGAGRRELSYWRRHYNEAYRPRRIESHDREPDMAAALRNSPMEPRNERVQEIDWVVALGLNTTTWRVTDPDDGMTVYTDDVGIAIDNIVHWDSEVVPVEQPERLESWLRI